MAVGYRAVVRLGGSRDAISVAEAQLASWFREKKLRGALWVTDWDGPGEHELGEKGTLSVVYDQDRPDGSRRRLYRFRETNADGVWTVSVFALDTPQAKESPQTLVIDVDADVEDPDEVVWKVAPPRLIRSILEANPAFDGDTPLTGEPLMIRGPEARTVLAAILDPVRTAAVIVAPLPWHDYESEWRTMIRSLTMQSVGVAATFIVDEAATTLLAENLPDSHGIDKGVIRTFAPQVDLESSADGLRHRMLYPGTLLKHVNRGRVSDYLAKRHAYSTRSRFIERELPSDVRRGLSILQRAEAATQRTRSIDRRVIQDRQIRPALNRSRESASSLVPSLVRQFVRRWLGPDKAPTDATFQELDELLERKTAEAEQWEDEWNKVAEDNDRLTDRLRDAEAQRDDLSIDITDAEDKLRQREREVTVLRQRLIEYGQPNLTYVEPDSESWNPPDDVMSLLDRITDSGADNHPVFDRVVFTGDVDKAREVDVREKSPRYAHAFWDFIRVLYDYAEGCAAGHITCGVHLYLKSDQIAGHKCHPDRHSATESESTLNRWGKERVFPVPVAVDPSGKVQMAAHFKPTWRNAFAPRMHYYDDTNGTGKVYIGYIGRHLTTKDT
ncbi:hypothetical protein BHQ15_09760 [Mycolicibacillus koreensis]|nr:hypothetical protein BHQ15_09760 [Mycolicibacillus koreensis]